MYILHGTWIPRATDEFVQTGAFYVWAETSAVRKVKSGYAVQYLNDQDLDAFLIQELPITGTSFPSLSHYIQTCHILLPSVGSKPLPSPELARHLVFELPEEGDVALHDQAISACMLPNILSGLSNIHFLTTYQNEEVKLGGDLLFWVHCGQLLKSILRKDQYIPALKYRPVKSKGKKARTFEIHPGWEIVSRDFESRLTQLIERMPLACAAASEQPHQGNQCYDAESLVRHFSECVLGQFVQETKLPQVFQRKIDDTLIQHCKQASESRKSREGRISHPILETLEHYEQWQAWRHMLTARFSDGFYLGFQLLEGDDQHTLWRLRLLVVSRQDPSLRLYLDDYWLLDGKAQQTIRQSFGQNFEQQLLLDLGQATRMYPHLWGALNTDQPVGLSLNLEDAFAFLKEYAWVLEEAGFKVMVPTWWTPEGRQRARLRLRASAPKASAGSANTPGYFSLQALVDYRYELAIGNQTITEVEWQQLVNAKTPLVQFRGQWIELDRDKMQQMLEFWQTHGNSDAQMPLSELLHQVATGENEVDMSRDVVLADILKRLNDPLRFEPIADPAAINGTLRDYQKRGVAWLQYLESIGLNGCLADDMGLGKTLQVITRLVTESADKRGPMLLIAPTSVLGNWCKEIEKFAPIIKPLVHHGSGREKQAAPFTAACRAHDIVITSFTLARMDVKLLQNIRWHRVVIDEAQNIKNPKTAQTKAILKLQAQHRLALTGTPVENRLMDLWSIFNFLNPGYLGKQAQYRRQFELPIQRDNDPICSALLKRLTQPFILRRLKTDKAIIQDLPDKVEHKQYCQLTREQASLYEAVVKEVSREIEEAEGIQRSGLILSTLIRLKQICNHPRQFLQDNSAFTPERSHKLERLTEMLEEVIAEDESLLIFTQFTDIGAALEKYLSRELDYKTFYLHGSISRTRRERMISAFQAPDSEPSAFILSLKAGGVGLNLTKANHVFHFDRWWNPAVENQATDRAFRIGQNRNVFVHKFVTLGTLEERIDQMIEDKRKLADSIVGSDESWLTKLDNESFKQLITLNRSAVMD